MKIDSFIYHLIIILIPGLFALRIFKSLSVAGAKKKQINSWYDVAVIVTYTFIASVIYDSIIIPIVQAIFQNQLSKTLIILTSTDKYFDVLQLVILIVIDLILGVVSAISFNNKWLYKFGKKFKITNHFGEEDVWSYFNNSNETEWIYVRNKANGLTYYGNIKLFSDSNEKENCCLEMYLCTNQIQASIFMIWKISIYVLMMRIFPLKLRS